MSDVYLIDNEQLEKLEAVAKQLQGGTDRERDYGHRLWLVVNEIKHQSTGAA